MSGDDFSHFPVDPGSERRLPDDDAAGASGTAATPRAPAAYDRRSVLKDGGLIGVAALGGLALAPPPPARPGAMATADDGGEVRSASGETSGETASSDVPYAGATVTTEDETPIARYQYAPDGDGYASTAPINVVVPLADASIGLPGVMAVLEEAGWTRGASEYARYAWDRERDDYVHQHASAAETYLGLHGRLHVRCWEFEDVVSMQAHEDSAVRPQHQIVTYTGARGHVERLFADTGWRVAPTAVDLTNGDEGDHDGLASIVRPPPETAGERDG